MEITSAAVPISSSLEATPKEPHRGVLPELGPGWIVLRDCALGGGGPRIGLALLHPGIGVAFVDLVARETNAVDRLRRALDARRFPAIFGGYPPIVRVILPVDDAAELHRLLTAAFYAEPPPALSGGDAWIGTARAAIEAELPIVAPERHLPRRRRHGALLLRTAALAALGGLAAAVLLSVPVPRGRSPGGPTIRPVALVAPAIAPSADPLAAALTEDDLTAHDVAEALLSAEGLTVTAAAYAPPLHQDAPTPAIAAAVEDVPEASAMDLAGQDAAPTAAVSDTPEASPREEELPVDEATAIEVAAVPEPDDVPAAIDTTIPTETPQPTATASIAAEPSTVELAPAPDDPPEHAAASSVPPVLRAAAYEPVHPAASQTSPVVASSRRTALPVSTAPPASDRGSGTVRCREILLRATMEGILPDVDRAFLRRGCNAPRG